MSRFLRPMWIVARRDFLAIVATPTFLLFLLAPLFMIGFGAVGGLGATQLADTSRNRDRIVVLAAEADRAGLEAADARLRPLFDGPAIPPRLVIRTGAGADAAVARAIAAEKGQDTTALLYGPLDRPVILERNSGGSSGRYLAALADQARRIGTDDPGAATVKPQFQPLSTGAPTNAARQGLGFAAVFVVFLLTLLLAGQAVGMLAEEKGNKVIEILAAAVPLESVFLGKLLGLLGVAVLFIAFWGGIFAAVGTVAVTRLPPDAAQMLQFSPATGWPAFLLLGIGYFTMAFLLLGAVFLGVGAQAGSVREIQMLSLPITIFQVGMFGLASAAANMPGSTLARVAEILPFSSPFAMAARAATDAALWPHLLALIWQVLWVALVIALGVRLFRSGVLGDGWRLKRRRPAAH